MQNQNPTNYDALLEIIRREIINEKLIDQRNRASRDLLPPQRQHGRGPTSHLINYHMSQPDNEIFHSSGQALATAILNVVPMLAYDDITPGANIQEAGYEQRDSPKIQGSRVG